MKCCLLCVSLCIMQNKNGELSERFKEPVLKTGDRGDSAVGSNPTLSAKFGQMSERFKVPVSKTGDGSCPSVGSNPTLSAKPI